MARPFVDGKVTEGITEMAFTSAGGAGVKHVRFVYDDAKINGEQAVRALEMARMRFIQKASELGTVQ